uniref:Uncharacterized protein n=1 Tax=Anopheles coluzzii TaxID=1518534 RepID=A0A8W7PTB1_ANOCL
MPFAETVAVPTFTISSIWFRAVSFHSCQQSTFHRLRCSETAKSQSTPCGTGIGPISRIEAGLSVVVLELGCATMRQHDAEIHGSCQKFRLALTLNDFGEHSADQMMNMRSSASNTHPPLSISGRRRGTLKQI